MIQQGATFITKVGMNLATSILKQIAKDTPRYIKAAYQTIRKA